MQGDVEGGKSAEAIAVICSCGKRLKAAPQHAGKQLKCPACGQPTLVPQATRSTSLSANSQPKDERSGTNRTVVLSLWGCVALVAIGCVLFVKWHSDGLQAARVESADQEISAAVAAADAWIADQKKGQSTEIEQRLARAIDVTDATKQADGRSALDRLRARRDLLAQQAALVEAQQKADGILDEAKREIDARRIPEAIVLLRNYVEEPHATHKADGQQLLAQAEIATSDARTLTILAALNDEVFARVNERGRLDDGKIIHPVLNAFRGEVVKRNLPKEAKRREALKIAAERKRELEREAVATQVAVRALEQAAQAQRDLEEMRKNITAERRKRELQGKLEFDSRKSDFAQKLLAKDGETAVLGAGAEMLDALKRVYGFATLHDLGDRWLKDQLDATTIRQTLSEPFPVKDPSIKARINWDRLAACRAFAREMGNLECSKTGLSCKWMLTEIMLRLEEDETIRELEKRSRYTKLNE
jgi:hypothetical protein